MSGGHFDYNQYRIEDIINELKSLITVNNMKDEWGYMRNYSEKTINEFKNALSTLKKAQIYTQRIDYLVSGDDGEETFHERLKKELDI